MKSLIPLLAFIIFSNAVFSQSVGISATGAASDNSAGLDINFANKGLLMPRISLLSTTDATTISSPATSLLVYNTNSAMIGGDIGYWYWEGTQWTKLLSTPNIQNVPTLTNTWATFGNTGTSSDSDFVGTRDNAGLSLRTNNIEAMHIDSMQNIGIGVANASCKFEEAGSFRLHKDSFNVLQTDDLFPAYLPGIQFTGSTYKPSGVNGTYINGIADTPPAAGDANYAISGYIDLSTGNQNVFLANTDGMGMNSQTNSTNSSINTDISGNLSLNTNQGSDTASSMNFKSSGINFYHGNTGIGNTNMTLNDTSFFQNINENVDNARNTNMQVRPNDYNVYNNDNQNGNSSALNFSSSRSNLHVSSPVANSHMNISDSVYDQYTSESITGRYTGIIINPDSHNIYNNDNLNGNYSGASFNSRGFNMYINSPANNSNFVLSDNTAFFTTNGQAKFGIGTNNPNSSLETAGSFGTAIVTINSDLTLDNTHYTIIITGGTPVITLPAPASDNNRRSYRIINQNNVPVDISAYIDFTGSTATTIPANSKIEVQSDGGNWYRVD